MYSKSAREFLKNKKYLIGDETLEERVKAIADVVREYEKDYSEGLGDRIESYITNKILIPSTPQWANLGREYKGSANLPASCYILGVENNIQGIYYSYGETAMMSKLGGGIGSSYINVYEEGTFLEEGFHSNSKMDWIEDGVRASQKVSQSSIRRGYSVPTIDINDKEFYIFLKRLDKKNPDFKDPLVKNNGCILLPTGFWAEFEKNQELQERFLTLIQKRMSKGKIYLIDEDNCNKNQSPIYKKLGMSVNATNICTEALTALDPRYSFVCMLASANLANWDIIKNDPQIIKDMYMFLDINISEYIRLTEDMPFMEKARKSAIEKRDIGLGTMGLHDLFQSKGIAFGSLESRFLNKEIYKTFREIGEEYTREIAEKLGSPLLCQEANMVRRNVSLMMIAPNKSTAGIVETSEGIAPRISNYMNEELAGINRIFKNPHLKEMLISRGKDNIKVWNSIMTNLGSVQHLDFLSDSEKAVFKTACEISPKDIIDLASDRQVYIDMAQSINLFGRPNYTTQDVYDIHRYAFKKDIKTLYYYYPQAHASIEKSGEKWDSCESCSD
jgi:ribonucleoside-diphosphate reductase alpha chain